MADTGFVIPTTFSSQDLDGVGSPWLNPGNAGAQDATYATEVAVNLNNASSLRGLNLSAPVPAGATIIGVEVVVRAKSSSPSDPFKKVMLVVAGTRTGSDLGTGSFALTTSDADYTFGGPTTLWGLTPTAADVNGATFGVAVQFSKNSAKSAPTISVDIVKMKIYYTGGGAAASSAMLMFF